MKGLSKEKTKKSKKARGPKKPSRADNASTIDGATYLGSLLGGLGASAGQKAFGKVLRENSSSLASGMDAVNIGDFKNYFGGEMGDLGESFIKDHKLRESGVTFNSRTGAKLDDYYNPIKNTVNTATRSETIALHEMGHAADYRGKLWKTVARKLPGAVATIAIPTALAFGDEIKEKIPGSIDDKVISFIQRNPVLTGLAGYTASTLYPEGKASYLALKHIAKKRNLGVALKAFSKSLGPAFGTYLLGALPIAAGYGVGKYMQSSLEEEHQKKLKTYRAKKKNLKKTASPNSKAFLLGATIGGVPIATYLKYRYGTEGGRAIGALQRESSVGSIGDKIDGALERNSNKTAIGGGLIVGGVTGYLTSKSMENMGLKRVKGLLRMLKK